jgi:hypothetical protein
MLSRVFQLSPNKHTCWSYSRCSAPFSAFCRVRLCRSQAFANPQLRSFPSVPLPCSSVVNITAIKRGVSWFLFSASVRVLPRQNLTGSQTSADPQLHSFPSVPFPCSSVARIRIRGPLRAYAFRGTDAENPHNSSGRLRRPAAATHAQSQPRTAPPGRCDLRIRGVRSRAAASWRRSPRDGSA